MTNARGELAWRWITRTAGILLLVVLAILFATGREIPVFWLVIDAWLLGMEKIALEQLRRNGK
jgi:hypothetical protein